MNKIVSLIVVLIFWLGLFFFLKMSQQKLIEEDSKVSKRNTSQTKDIRAIADTSKNLIVEEDVDSMESLP